MMLVHHEKKAPKPGTPDGSTGLEEGRSRGSNKWAGLPFGDQYVLFERSWMSDQIRREARGGFHPRGLRGHREFVLKRFQVFL